MYPTKNDLPEATRRKMIELCNARLADAIDLQTQTKQAHWNVKGPYFIALHELFDKVNADVEDYVDLIAERAVQLGGTADGTARSVANRSTLPDYPVKTGNDYYAFLGRRLNRKVELTLNDKPTPEGAWKVKYEPIPVTAS